MIEIEIYLQSLLRKQGRDSVSKFKDSQYLSTNPIAQQHVQN